MRNHGFTQRREEGTQRDGTRRKEEKKARKEMASNSAAAQRGTQRGLRLCLTLRLCVKCLHLPYLLFGTCSTLVGSKSAWARRCPNQNTTQGRTRSYGNQAFNDRQSQMFAAYLPDAAGREINAPVIKLIVTFSHYSLNVVSLFSDSVRTIPLLSSDSPPT